MITFCLYAQFLLVSPSGDCDLKIMQILDQVESRLNPVPIILAETMIGLDNLSVTHCFAGSPVLLEVINFFSFPLLHSIFADLASREIEAVSTPTEHCEVQSKAGANWFVAEAPDGSERMVGQFSDVGVQWICP